MRTVKEAQVKSDIEKAIDDFLKSIGVEYAVISQGKGVKALGSVMDKWEATFSKGNVLRDFDFYTGIGHRVIDGMVRARLREYYKATPNKRRHELEKASVPFPPFAASVLHSLILDSSACDQSFDSWCADYGYDNDSIKARNTYDACQKNTDNMRAIFSRDQIEKLSELLQDY